MAIKYNNKLNNEINRVVRNFNAKVKRLERSENDLILPNTISVRELKKDVTNKWELNRKLKELQLYSTKGIERTVTTPGGVTTSEYNLVRLEREQRRLSTKLGKTIKDIEGIRPTVGGVPLDVTYKQMGSQRLANLKARRLNIRSKKIRQLDKESFKSLVKTINATRAKENYLSNIFMDNYIDQMLFKLGYAIDYDKSKLDFIKNNMMRLNTRQFMKMFDKDLLIQSVRDFYPTVHMTDPKSFERNIEQITEIYDNLYNNIVDIVGNYQK